MKTLANIAVEAANLDGNCSDSKKEGETVLMQETSQNTGGENSMITSTPPVINCSKKCTCHNKLEQRQQNKTAVSQNQKIGEPGEEQLERLKDVVLRDLITSEFVEDGFMNSTEDTEIFDRTYVSESPATPTNNQSETYTKNFKDTIIVPVIDLTLESDGIKPEWMEVSPTPLPTVPTQRCESCRTKFTTTMDAMDVNLDSSIEDMITSYLSSGDKPSAFRSEPSEIGNNVSIEDDVHGAATASNTGQVSPEVSVKDGSGLEVPSSSMTTELISSVFSAVSEKEILPEYDVTLSCVSSESVSSVVASGIILETLTGADKSSIDTTGKKSTSDINLGCDTVSPANGHISVDSSSRITQRLKSNVSPSGKEPELKLVLVKLSEEEIKMHTQKKVKIVVQDSINRDDEDAMDVSDNFEAESQSNTSVSLQKDDNEETSCILVHEGTNTVLFVGSDGKNAECKSSVEEINFKDSDSDRKREVQNAMSITTIDQDQDDTEVIVVDEVLKQPDLDLLDSESDSEGEVQNASITTIDQDQDDTEVIVVGEVLKQPDLDLLDGESESDSEGEVQNDSITTIDQDQDDTEVIVVGEVLKQPDLDLLDSESDSEGEVQNASITTIDQDQDDTEELVVGEVLKQADCKSPSKELDLLDSESDGEGGVQNVSIRIIDQDQDDTEVLVVSEVLEQPDCKSPIEDVHLLDSESDRDEDNNSRSSDSDGVIKWRDKNCEKWMTIPERRSRRLRFRKKMLSFTRIKSKNEPKEDKSGLRKSPDIADSGNHSSEDEDQTSVASGGNSGNDSDTKSQSDHEIECNEAVTNNSSYKRHAAAYASSSESEYFPSSNASINNNSDMESDINIKGNARKRRKISDNESVVNSETSCFPACRRKQIKTAILREQLERRKSERLGRKLYIPVKQRWNLDSASEVTSVGGTSVGKSLICNKNTLCFYREFPPRWDEKKLSSKVTENSSTSSSEEEELSTRVKVLRNRKIRLSSYSSKRLPISVPPAPQVTDHETACASASDTSNDESVQTSAFTSNNKRLFSCVQRPESL